MSRSEWVRVRCNREIKGIRKSGEVEKNKGKWGNWGNSGNGENCHMISTHLPVLHGFTTCIV